jgi:thioredoxin-dependent peroxiredoxin
MTDRTGVFTFAGKPLTLTGSPVKVGEKAPSFVALRRDLSGAGLDDFKGKVLVISAVTSLDTSVCATQARRFNEAAAGLGDQVKVVVISMDLPFAQGRFCTTEGIANLETLSDHRDASFGLAYGLLIKELRLLARAVTVVDAGGVVRYHQMPGEGTHEPDYDAALAAARKLL